ncbi:L,D-transpeptidase [Candidatus Peregrinibacteria bacterium]|nr:L,D-transpeptidase [Candidatus Peregrinibacteria bacterium]
MKRALLTGIIGILGSVILAGNVYALQPANTGIKREMCGFDWPDEQKYDAKLVAVRKKLTVDPGEKFEIKVFLKNMGNMPWFSTDSACPGPRIFLGTDKERDHASFIYAESANGWAANNRIKVDQLRVEPGEIASFSFEGVAPKTDEAYKEYFTPMIKEIQWMDGASFAIETIVGEPAENAASLRKKFSYVQTSGPLSMLDLNGERSIYVDLSDQWLKLKIGDYVVREFPVSSGHPVTHPTPPGNYTIDLKQEVRIGSKSPYYIMPNYMWFRTGGYGFHALPSLGSAQLRGKIKSLQAAGKPVPTSLYKDDVLWNEALDHIGRPVSHGCVRLLPNDSDFMFNFADIGTKVTIVR